MIKVVWSDGEYRHDTIVKVPNGTEVIVTDDRRDTHICNVQAGGIEIEFSVDKILDLEKSENLRVHWAEYPHDTEL